MFTHDPYDFDVDVDVSQVLEGANGETLIDDGWYELTHRVWKDPVLKMKADRAFRSVMLRAQWSASTRRAFDRRRAVRVPLLSRVHLEDTGHMVATDISLSGIRASGRPRAPLMDVEFKIPGAPFPIDTRVEVMSFKDANVIPLVGLRFVDLDRPYREYIAQYIHRKRHSPIAA